MKEIYKFSFLTFFVFFLVDAIYAQNNFFTDAGENRAVQTSGQREIFPQKFRTSGLEVQSMKNFLWSLPSENNVLYNRNNAPVLELPMPDGKMARFHVWESSIMEPGLAAKFPDMKTFAGQGIDDPLATIRLDYNPYFGFHAQILSPNGRVYIDPYARYDVNIYISYFTKDNAKYDQFICKTAENFIPNRTEEITAGPCRGTELFTYRLALACTGEYAIAVAGPVPSVPAVAAALLTTVNRVDGIYETEVSLRMILVANNDLLIYLDGSTDPYTNNDGAVMLGQNQTNIDAIIGSANYDIGHVVSTGGGGFANLRVPCTVSKARGVTGLSNPVGDNFDVDYVAHEMGHQWGGNHTFNSSAGSCGGVNRNGGTAYEVGSGTTIMAYAGICSSDDTQPHSDPFFHAVSFDEISNFISTGSGNLCKVATPTGNSLPVITAVNNNGVSIPVGTPFTLSATATDANSDPLTYCWEEWDLGPTTPWNGGNANTTSPLFKSRAPKTTGDRTFPDIAVIQAGYPVNPPATMGGLKGETLPTSPRVMNFRLTVRDNRAGGGGVVSSGSGCQDAFSFQVNVVGSIPFTVLSPNGGESFAGGSTQTITWNNASTDGTPFNVTNVKISLSTDGGFTYPTVIIASTANDGSEALAIPAIVTSAARIKIEAIGNIFFDVSNSNFSITAPPGGFSFSNPVPVVSACPAPATMQTSLNATYLGGFTGNISLSSTVSPAGPVISLTPATLTTSTTSTTVAIINANALSPGTYTVTVTGTEASVITQTRDVLFTINPGPGPAITGQPSDQTICIGLNTSFSIVSASATAFQWQVSTDGGTNYTNVTNGGVYSNATTSTLNITGATAILNNYRYRCIASIQCGSTISNAGILSLNTFPAISTQPQSSTICLASNTSFTAAATGTGVGYQWQLSTDGGTVFNNMSNGGVYSGATTATLVITSATAAMNNYRYRVTASGICTPAVNSSAAILTVINPVTITGQPTPDVICSGSNANFTVTGSSSQTIIYQWQVSTDGGTVYSNVSNGGLYSGATTSTLTITGATTSLNSNLYRCQLSSSTCTSPTTSSAGLLTVRQLPTVSLAASPQTSLLPGQTTLLTATPSISTGGVLTTTWQYNVAASSPPITGNSYQVNVETIGTYQVLIQETFSSPALVCANQSDVITIDASISSRLFIFPSPNDGRFTVSYYNNGGSSTKRKIAIYDSKGASVYNAEFAISGPYTLIDINMERAGRGLYIVVVGDASGKKLTVGKVHIR